MPLGLMMNSTREEQPPEVEVFVRVRIRCLLLWWLDLFIEALVLFPNIEREPTTAGKFEGGQLVQAILTKAVFAREKHWW